MNDPNVTHVTRNDNYAELKVLFDLVAWVVMLYLMIHPEAFDRIPEIARGWWRKFVHAISVWTARQDIRSLPETEE